MDSSNSTDFALQALIFESNRSASEISPEESPDSQRDIVRIVIRAIRPAPE